jgi:hypothetical protein
MATKSEKAWDAVPGVLFHGLETKDVLQLPYSACMDQY